MAQHDRKWLTYVIIAGPAVHLGLCYYYLFLRSFGFGSNVSEFVAAGDVFTVGLSKLLSTYMIFFGGLIFGYLWMDADPLKVSGKTDIELHPSLERPSIRIGFKSVPYVAGLGIAVIVITRQAVPMLLFTFVMIPIIAKVAHALVIKNNLKPFVSAPLIMIPIGALNLSFSAYSEGFRFRHRPPEFFQSYAKCTDGAVVLFSMGERYVATSSAGERLLLAGDCKPILKFPRSKVDLDVL